jgi:Mannosyltransferase (PIG-V)
MNSDKSPLTKKLLRVRDDPSVRRAFFVFTLTRVLLLAIVIVGGQMSRITNGSGETTRDMSLSLGTIPVYRVLQETITTADVNWYYGIALNGYEKIPFNADRPHNWAFFPLFPLLWRLAAHLTGEYPISGMLISHLCFLLGLIFVHKVALAFGFSKALADRSLFYLAVFPTSYFYSLPLTESLFLQLTAVSLYSAKRGRWWTAGVAGALASATRVTGIFIFPALAVLYWETFGGEWRRKGVWRSALLRKEFLSLLLVPVGIGSFMVYLYTITGNPLAFKDILVTWGRGTGFFVVTLWRYLRNPWLIAVPWDFRTINFAGAALALICGGWLLKRRQWTLGAYTLLCVIAALSSLVLQSQARYAMVLFPIYFILARAGERPYVDETIRTISIALLCLMTALFAAHFSIALS